MLSKEYQENTVGIFSIFYQEDETFSFFSKNITEKEYDEITSEDPIYTDCFPEAAFWVSALPFREAEKIEWQITSGQIVYVDKIAINPKATGVIPVVLCDTIVEYAEEEKFDAVRIKIEQQSPFSDFLQESNFEIVDVIGDFAYFEIDTRKKTSNETKEEMSRILNRFDDNDIYLVDEDKREAFNLFARMQSQTGNDAPILDELRKYPLYNKKYNIATTDNRSSSTKLYVLTTEHRDIYALVEAEDKDDLLRKVQNNTAINLLNKKEAGTVPGWSFEEFDFDAVEKYIQRQSDGIFPEKTIKRIMSKHIKKVTL